MIWYEYNQLVDSKLGFENILALLDAFGKEAMDFVLCYEKYGEVLNIVKGYLCGLLPKVNMLSMSDIKYNIPLTLNLYLSIACKQPQMSTLIEDAARILIQMVNTCSSGEIKTFLTNYVLKLNNIAKSRKTK